MKPSLLSQRLLQRITVNILIVRTGHQHFFCREMFIQDIYIMVAKLKVTIVRARIDDCLGWQLAL